MSTSRSIKRKKEMAARKAARKASKKVSKSLSQMPEECTVCKTSFDKTCSAMIDTWIISVHEKEKISLVCPNCSIDQ